MHSKKLYATFVVIVVFVAIFFLKEKFNGELYQDEFHYLPTAVFFSNEPVPSLDLLKSYNELNTPLPFILGGWVVNAFGEDIQYLRLLTFGVSFLLLMIFIWASPSKSKRFELCLAGLVFFPNYYLCSVYYYTDIFAMVSVLAGVVAYLKKSHLPAAIFFIAGVASRQYMLAFPSAIVVFELLAAFKNAVDIKQFFRNIVVNKTWVFYSIAVLSIVPWVLLWHGPAPAAVMADQHYDSDKLVQYNFGYVLYSSAILAVYYVIPEALLTRKYKYYFAYPSLNPKLFLALLVGVIVLICFFPAKQAFNPYFTWPYLGYLDQFLMTIGIAGLLKQVVFGLLMLITLLRFVSRDFNLASCIVLINILLLGKAQLSWDKYSLPMIMTLWFLAMFDKEWGLAGYDGQKHKSFKSASQRSTES